MNEFATPQWDSNPAVDKICSELFKKSNSLANQKTKNKRNKKKSEIKSGGIQKAKPKKHQKLKATIKNIKNAELPTADDTKSSLISTFTKKDNVRNKNDKSRSPKNNLINNKNQGKKLKLKNKISQNARIEPQSENMEHLQFEEVENKMLRKQRNQITHQTLFSGLSRKFHSKLNKKIKLRMHIDDTEAVNIKNSSKKKRRKINQKLEDSEMQASQLQTDSMIADAQNKNKIQKYSEKLKMSLEQKKPLIGLKTKKQIATLPLRERMVEKLKAARFRYLNEQMYTSIGKDSQKFFKSDPDAYTAYHEGYQQQVARWPLNPLDVIIEKITKLPQSYVIADFGCGEANLAQSVQQRVHSFDLVAINEHVTACDMAHVPLENNSVNVVVFCLSLMGTNLKDYLLEANRVLKMGGMLKIAEVESRFEDVDAFIKNIQSFGFTKTGKDLSHNLFCFLDFVKKDSKVKQKNKLPDVSLSPCLYKRR